jgi:hypothetical protein
VLSGGFALDPRETLYHGTGPSAAASIKEKGFDPAENTDNVVDDQNRTFFARPTAKDLAQNHANENWATEKAESSNRSYADALSEAKSKNPQEGMLKTRLPVFEMDSVYAGHRNALGNRSTIGVTDEISPEYIKGSGAYSGPGVKEIGRYIKETPKGKVGLGMGLLGLGGISYGANEMRKEGETPEEMTLEDADGPLAAGAAGAVGTPALIGAAREAKGASNLREVLMKGTAGAIDGLGSPGRMLQKGRKTWSDMPLTLPGSVDRLKESYGLGKPVSYYENLAEEASKSGPSENQIKTMLGEGAQVQGSQGLGINLPKEEADVDVAIPTLSDKDSEEIIGSLQNYFDDLKSSPYNRFRNHSVLSGNVQGQDMDISVGKSDEVHNRVQRFEELKSDMSMEQKGRIIDQKQSLNNSSVFPKARYKRYKKDIDKALDIPRI